MEMKVARRSRRVFQNLQETDIEAKGNFQKNRALKPVPSVRDCACLKTPIQYIVIKEI